MSAADAAIGIMDGAYFVGRKELLEFFNDLLDLNLTKIEQTASGAVACQVTDMIFPGSIPMVRVNWEAKSDYEYVQNYKLLQAAFTKHRVQRHVDVDKLIRAKYQDNLEFCQWLKAFYDQATGGSGGGGGGGGARQRGDYDPAAVRAKGKGGKRYNQLQGSGRRKPGGGGGGTFTTNSGGAAAGSTGRSQFSTATSSAPVSRTHTAMNKTTIDASHDQVEVNATSRNTNGATRQQQQLQAAENAQLSEKIAELESTLEEVEKERDQTVMDVEKERDFYFGKLRSIEVMLQVHQETTAATLEEQHNMDDPSSPAAVLHSLVDRMFQILYATAEDNLTVNAQGQVVDAATVLAEEEEGGDALDDDDDEDPEAQRSGDSLLSAERDED